MPESLDPQHPDPAQERLGRFLIVGAGLSGAVLARTLAEGGYRCDVFEEKGHVAGHCHTERDPETGILVHRYGPHTLHSDDQRVWTFVEQHAAVWPYRHRKVACAGGIMYPFPISLPTLSQFFGRPLNPAEGEQLVSAAAASSIQLSGPPGNFEEAALSRIGRDLYEAFFEGYTIKQWGRHPRELPAAIFGRLPIRFTDDSNYFHHNRQGQPVGGYTAMVLSILAHDNIRTVLRRPFSRGDDSSGYDHVFYSGALDRYFDYEHGRLGYRTLHFEDERGHATFQDFAVVNYCDADVPYTRVTEHKHFSPWEQAEATIRSFEYSSECTAADAPYYPLRLSRDRALLDVYVSAARATCGLSFLGRLGTYRYIDMDVAISEAMQAGAVALSAVRDHRPIPTFFKDI